MAITSSMTPFLQRESLDRLAPVLSNYTIRTGKLPPSLARQELFKQQLLREEGRDRESSRLAFEANIEGKKIAEAQRQFDISEGGRAHEARKLEDTQKRQTRVKAAGGAFAGAAAGYKLSGGSPVGAVVGALVGVVTGGK